MWQGEQSEATQQERKADDLDLYQTGKDRVGRGQRWGLFEHIQKIMTGSGDMSVADVQDEKEMEDNSFVMGP